jgi:hypothetical protein
MYRPRKKSLPACWHLSSVLLESEVWVRPAQVGALFLHNLRVCLTFWQEMYPQNNVALFLHNLRVCLTFWHVMYPQNNVALFLHKLTVCWLFWHTMYLQNNVALFWHNLSLCWLFWPVSGSVSEGVRCRVMAIHWYRPFWVPGTRKWSCVQTETWCPCETLAMSLTWGCRWLVRLGVLFFAFNIYRYVIFSFIEVDESKFIRVQWKRLFPCAVHVSLLSVRSHVSCLISVFWMFANQTLGEYSIKT